MYRNCCQIPYATGGECSKLWCSKFGPLIFIKLRSVQGRLRYLPLVNIWVDLPDLLEGETLGQIQVIPRCGSPLGIFGTSHPWDSSLFSSRPHQYLVCYTSGMMAWMIIATAWCSRNLDTLWWCAGGVTDCIGSIPQSYIQQFRVYGGITPLSSLSVVHISGLPLWKGASKYFRYLPCKFIPWYCGCMTGACNLPCPGGFPKLSWTS